MMFFLVWVFHVTVPTEVPGVTARTVAVQSVRESGNLTETVALPLGLVRTAGCQNAVARKSSRTSGSTRGAAAPAPPPLPAMRLLSPP